MYTLEEVIRLLSGDLSYESRAKARAILKHLREKSCYETSGRSVVAVISVGLDGDKQWRNAEGELHRVDGPAMECKDGSCYWFSNGKLHRENGPAVNKVSCAEHPGHKEWYRYGKVHREDGPASEWEDGTKTWWLNGKFIRHPV